MAICQQYDNPKLFEQTPFTNQNVLEFGHHPLQVINLKLCNYDKRLNYFWIYNLEKLKDAKFY